MKGIGVSVSRVVGKIECHSAYKGLAPAPSSARHSEMSVVIIGIITAIVFVAVVVKLSFPFRTVQQSSASSFVAGASVTTSFLIHPHAGQFCPGVS